MRLTRAAARVALVTTAALAVPVAWSAPPAQAAEGYLCTGIGPDDKRSATTVPSIPYELLGIERATELLAERGITPGEGVRVAVVDSGVSLGPPGAPPLAPLSVTGFQSFGTNKPVLDGHGTNVAGLVAGGEREDGQPTGIAPGAEIVDVRVYDEPNENGVGGIGQTDVIDALNWLAANAEEQGIGVVVTAFDLPPSAAFRAAITALSKRDVIIVAGSGNRPDQEGQQGFEEYGEAQPGENAEDLIFPAGYTEHVFAVTSTAAGIPVAEDEVADAAGTVLLSGAIDAAVPTYGAVTLAPNGATCLIDKISTSWAAGVAGGVVALVRSAYPRENADQIEARLLATASGTLGSPTTATGAGVLQPVEALTQRLAPTRRGAVDDMPRENLPQPQVSAPVAETDPLTATLGDARWWGLFGGATLVVALLVRPLLARRRSG